MYRDALPEFMQSLPQRQVRGSVTPPETLSRPVHQNESRTTGGLPAPRRRPASRRSGPWRQGRGRHRSRNHERKDGVTLRRDHSDSGRAAAGSQLLIEQAARRRATGATTRGISPRSSASRGSSPGTAEPGGRMKTSSWDNKLTVASDAGTFQHRSGRVRKPRTQPARKGRRCPPARQGQHGRPGGAAGTHRPDGPWGQRPASASSQGERPCQQPGDRSNSRSSSLDVAQHLLGWFEQRGSGRSQVDSMPDPGKEPRPNFGFEVLHGERQRWLRHEGGPGRGRESSVLRHRDEVSQLATVHLPSLSNT